MLHNSTPTLVSPVLVKPKPLWGVEEFAPTLDSELVLIAHTPRHHHAADFSYLQSFSIQRRRLSTTNFHQVMAHVSERVRREFLPGLVVITDVEATTFVIDPQYHFPQIAWHPEWQQVRGER